MEIQVLSELGYTHFGGILALISGRRGYPIKFEIICKILINADGVILTVLGCEGSWPELNKLVDLLRARKYIDLVEGPLFQQVKSECRAAGLNVSSPDPGERPYIVLNVKLDQTLRMSFRMACDTSFKKYSKPLMSNEISKVQRAVSAVLFFLAEEAYKNTKDKLDKEPISGTSEAT